MPENIKITRELAGKRIDASLAKLTGLSRSRIKELIDNGHIKSASGQLKASAAAHAGELFTIDLPDTAPTNLIAEDIELDILYEDEHLLIVNKPAHMVVHPSAGHDSGTLVHALLNHCDNLPGINGVERPGIVHRLDKDTSGSLVVAKTEYTHRKLVEKFSVHDIRREYIAWVRGCPSWYQQRVEQPIGRHPRHRQKMAIVANGKHAITDVQVEQRFFEQLSRLRLTLHTGRTHQIRVHLSHLHLPILGDVTYGRGFYPRNVTDPAVLQAIQALDRQALHAELIGFEHPVTSEEILVRAPLPEMLVQLDRALTQADTAFISA